MGYNMAKHGVVALTKGFKFAEPNVYDTEGIKCYAIAPYYVDTNLVCTSHRRNRNDPKSVPENKIYIFSIYI